MHNARPSLIVANAGGSQQRRPVNEGYLRMGPLTRLPQLLRERGIDPVELISEVGLDLSLFDDAENVIPFVVVGQLLKWGVARLKCPHFGLLLGQRSGLDCLGIVGDLVKNMPDVGSALRNLVLHLHIHDGGAVPALSVDQGMAATSYLIYQPGVEGSDQIYDAAMAITFNILRALCGSAWRPATVLFSHHPPDDSAPYRRFFQAPLRFDREQTALVFPTQWLDRAVVGADPHRRRQLEQQIATLENLDPHDLVTQLRRVLRVLLITHRGSLEQVAQLFSMHRRTLNRRLVEQDCTFQGLVNEVRYEIARQLLANTHMPISQITATLDYKDAPSFSRAFRRWSGIAPVKWRARLPAENAHT